VPYIVEPYLVQGELHLLVGDGGSCKTFLALDTALGLAAGQPVFLDRMPERPYRVLYVDEDGGPGQTARRVLGLAAGRGINFCGEVAERFTAYSLEGLRLDEEPGLSRLRYAVNTHEPEVIIFDAMRGLHGKSENDSQDMAFVVRKVLKGIAKECGVTIIVVHHTSKELWQSRKQKRSPAQASRGSGEIRNGCDTLLYVERTNGVSVLTIDKTRNLGDDEKPDPLGFDVRKRGDGSLGIVRAEETLAPKRPKQDMARRELEATLPVGSAEKPTFTELINRLPGIEQRKYSKRIAQEVLKGLVGTVFAKEEQGKNTRYHRLGGA
jgi:hypothetical protein